MRIARFTTGDDPAYGLVDEQINLPFTVQSRILREIRTTVELEAGAGVVARREIIIPPMAQTQASVVWVPSVEGDQTLKLRLPVDPEEIRRDNNERAFRIAVRREEENERIVSGLKRALGV